MTISDDEQIEPTAAASVVAVVVVVGVSCGVVAAVLLDFVDVFVAVDCYVLQVEPYFWALVHCFDSEALDE